MSDEEVALPNGEKIRVFITDPLVQFDFDYGDEVDDDLPEEEYKQLLLSTFTDALRSPMTMQVYSLFTTRKPLQKFTMN